MICPNCGHALKPRLGLTARQSELLTYIREYRVLFDRAPSYVEMAKELGLRSTNDIHRLVTNLEERGHIRRMPGQARSISVIEAAHA